jgi:hypothetical protein
VESNPITVSYPQQYCSEYVFSIISQTADCFTYSSRLVTVRPFIPSFAYNYNCGSTILTAYIPVYLYIYTAHILFNVFAPYLIILTYPTTQLGDPSPPRLLRRLLPGIYWPELWVQHRNDGVIRRLYPVEAIVDSLIQHSIIFFSFGLCSPFLTLAIAITFWLIIVRWKVLLTRGLLKLEVLQRDHPNLSPEVDSLASSLHHLTSSLLPSLRSKLWIPTVSSCIFFAFVCWDISGDAVGWENSIWVPCVTISLAILLWVMTLRSVRRGDSQRRSESQAQASLPLKEKRREEKNIDSITSTHSIFHQQLWPPLFPLTSVSEQLRLDE